MMLTFREAARQFARPLRIEVSRIVVAHDELNEDEDRKQKVVTAIQRLIAARARGSLEGVLQELTSLSGGRRTPTDKPTIPNYYLRDLEQHPLFKITDALYRALHAAGEQGDEKQALNAPEPKRLLDQLEQAVKKKVEAVERRFRMSLPVLAEEGIGGKLGRWALGKVPGVGGKMAAKDYIKQEIIPAIRKAMAATQQVEDQLKAHDAKLPAGTEEKPHEASTEDATVLAQDLERFMKNVAPRALKATLEKFFEKHEEHAQLEKSPFPLRAVISQFWGSILKNLALLWKAEIDFKGGHDVELTELTKAANDLHRELNRMGAVFVQILRGTA